MLDNYNRANMSQIEREGERLATRAIIVVGGKVLLGKRGRGIGKDQFALVGGKPDEGETLEQAIVREVEEETGLKFINPMLWVDEVNDKTIPGQVWHTYYFLGEVEGELRLKVDEIPQVVYVGKDDLSELDIAFGHKEVLDRFFNEVGEV